jgi:hypothetical protein
MSLIVVGYTSWHAAYEPSASRCARCPNRRVLFRGRIYDLANMYNTQSGVINTRIYQGSTDGELIIDFIREPLPTCGCRPEPNSVLVIDSASFHQGASIKALCNEASVMLFF